MVSLKLEKGENRQILTVYFADKTSTFEVNESSKIEDFEVQNEKYFTCEICNAEIRFRVAINHTPEIPQPIPFNGIEGSVIHYNDGRLQRGRYPKLLIYVRNHVYEFEGQNIPGICVVENKDYTKAGKWSNTTYQIRLAAGVKSSQISPNFESSKYVDDVTSINKIAEQLGLDGVQNLAIEIFCKSVLPNTWKRYEDYLDNLDQISEMESRISDNFIRYEYNEHIIVHRTGYNRLLVNDILFDGENIPDLVQIVGSRSYSGHRGGGKIWELMIPASANVVELPEKDPYGGNDSLESRGYTVRDGKWIKTSEIIELNEPNPDSPFAILNGIFK